MEEEEEEEEEEEKKEERRDGWSMQGEGGGCRSSAWQWEYPC
jgi:hypothetical protein